jgi:KaiC/GvpD/RAD55 family RecA-like ATPase
MVIPIDIVGLDNLIPSIGDGKVVVVESGLDPAKSYFIRRIALSAARTGGSFVFLTSRGQQEVLDLLKAERPVSATVAADPDSLMDVIELGSIEEAGDLGDSSAPLFVVDSFSMLTLSHSPGSLAELMQEFRSRCQKNGTIFVLGTDRGMQDSRSEAIIAHLSDGVIEFHTKEIPDGLTRYLRVPKWTDGKFIDRNVYYDFNGKRMAIDVRRRVL